MDAILGWVLVMGIYGGAGGMTVQIPMTHEACHTFLTNMHDQTGFEFEYCVNQKNGRVMAFDDDTNSITIIPKIELPSVLPE